MEDFPIHPFVYSTLSLDFRLDVVCYIIRRTEYALRRL